MKWAGCEILEWEEKIPCLAPRAGSNTALSARSRPKVPRRREGGTPPGMQGCEAWSGLDRRVRERQDPGVVGYPFILLLDRAVVARDLSFRTWVSTKVRQMTRLPHGGSLLLGAWSFEKAPDFMRNVTRCGMASSLKRCLIGHLGAVRRGKRPSRTDRASRVDVLDSDHANQLALTNARVEADVHPLAPLHGISAHTCRLLESYSYTTTSAGINSYSQIRKRRPRRGLEEIARIRSSSKSGGRFTPSST